MIFSVKSSIILAFVYQPQDFEVNSIKQRICQGWISKAGTRKDNFSRLKSSKLRLRKLIKL